jgi:hypothetical protein
MKGGNLPNFFILGAAKAGTTSLYNILKMHPDVYFPFNKEPMFFSNDEIFKKGIDWYSKTYFMNSEHQTAIGEASPHYLYWSDKVSSRLHEVYAGEEIKFLVILRDPVARAYSWYWNMVKEGNENESFETALALENQRFLDNQESLYHNGSMMYGYYQGGRYATQLKAYLQLFPYGKFHLIFQENLTSLFDDTLKSICRFLGIDERIQLDHAVSNPAAMPRSRRLHQYIRGQSWLKEPIKILFPFKIRYLIKNAVLRANLKTVKYPPMDEKTMESLRSRFDDEIKHLEQLIGRDLSHWRSR